MARRTLLAVWVAVALIALVPGARFVRVAGADPLSASAASGGAVSAGSISTFASSYAGMSEPRKIAVGPDGALWFTNTFSIGRVSTTGKVSNFPDPRIQWAEGIVAGPDGALWFANSRDDSIGRITTGGALSFFRDPTIQGPRAIVAGPDGALWFTNTGFVGSSIGRISTTGGVSNYVSPAAYRPLGIAVGPDGALWFTNEGSLSIPPSVGRVTTAGAIANYTSASIVDPLDIVAGPDGALWFTIHASHSIGRITTAGAVSTFTDSSINYPFGITVGSDGALWFTNSGSLGRITVAGAVSSFTDPAIGQPAGLVFGPDGALWFTNYNATDDSIGRMTTSGAVTYVFNHSIRGPGGIAAGPDGALWFTNGGYRGNNSIGRIATDGTTTNFTGNDIAVPDGITAGPDGALWFTNSDNDSIGRVTTAGQVSHFRNAAIRAPAGITAGPDGALWFANLETNSIGRITTAGTVKTFTASGLDQPYRITTGPDGNLWFTTATKIGRITPAGAISLFTGQGISHPLLITTGADGRLWFSNNGNNSLGTITTAGVVTNIALPGISQVGGIARGQDGAMWFTAYNTIGRISANGTVSQFHGTSSPHEIVAGPDNAMWFTNAGNDTIGRIQVLGAPSAPVAVEALASYRSAAVTWAAPGADGGMPVTQYTVTASPGGHTCVWTSGPLTCTVPGLVTGAPHTFNVTASNANGTGPASIPSSNTPVAGAGFHALAPTRVLDSRGPLGGWGAPLDASTPRPLTVTGPSLPSSASAVVLNLTVTAGTAGSFLKAWPTGLPPPVTSNLNFAPGETVANLVTVAVGFGGQISFANAVGSVHVVVDAVGYYDDGSGGDRYNGVAPQRVLDSRTSTGGWNAPLSATAPRDLSLRQPQIATGVPSTATAVIMNVTATNPTAGSFLSLWPAGEARPTASVVNFGPHQTKPNLTMVQLGANGAITVANAVGQVDVVLDLVGYFDAATGSQFHGLPPMRILDSRSGIGATGPWGQGQSRPLVVAGTEGVPENAAAVVMNTTATQGTMPSFLTVSPSDAPTPTASNLNFGPGETTANLVIAPLSANGALAIYNNQGDVSVIADVAGYFSP